MDIGRALKFPMNDPGWVGKVALGSLLGLVPIVNFAQQGYTLEVLSRVARGEGEELPPWDGLGRYISRGFGLSVAGMLYVLPMLVLVMLLAVRSFADGGAGIVLVFPVMFVYLLVMGLLYPAGMTRYALTGRWVSLFDFGWMLGYLGQNLGGYLLVLIVGSLVSMLLALVGTIVLFVGAIVAGFWASLMFSHLWGQLAYEASH